MSKNLIEPRKVNGKVVAWRVNFTNPVKGAKPRRIRYGHYETKEQAYEVAEQDYLNRRIRGRNPQTFSDLTINDLIERFIVHRGKQDYLKWVGHHIGDVDIRQVNSHHYQILIADCKKAGNTNKTINRKLDILKSMLNLAIELEWIESFPKISKLKEQPHTYYVFDEEDINNMYLQCVGEYEYMRDPIEFTLSTGLRKGNIIGLKKSHFIQTLHGLLLRIPASQTKQGKTTGKDYELHLTNKQEALIKRNWDDANEHIFKGYDNKESLGNFRRAFEGIMKRAGVQEKAKALGTKARFHDLRHTALTRLAEAGASAFVIQKVAGHSDIKMSEKYVHANPEYIRQQMEETERRFVPDSVPCSNKLQKKGGQL